MVTYYYTIHLLLPIVLESWILQCTVLYLIQEGSNTLNRKIAILKIDCAYL